jgi:membrane fusion protein (multidrug efflux system)
MMDQEPQAAGKAGAAARLERRAAQRRWLIGGGVAATIAGLALFYFLTGRYESTDDASLQAAQASISANVAGRVVAIEVHDNQRVRRGDVLFRLDDQPYRIAVAEAAAKLAAARLQIGAAEVTYRQKLADVAAADSTVKYRQEEFVRQEGLVASGISSRSQFEQAQHGIEQARAQLASAQQQSESVLALLGGDPKLPVDLHPSVQQAQAALDKAKLDLSYTVVRAPDDGVVAKVEQLQVGDYINAAMPVFTLISTRDVWIEANFKEDQLAYMRPGQSADVALDAVAGRALKARIVSLSPGTGSQFSALPPENATGNWVKVVQRLPVRLQFDPSLDVSDLPLRAGLSATVTVDTRHRRRLFASDEPLDAQAGAPQADARP